MIKEIGMMIYELRKRAYVSQETLGRGLISIADLSRIENGEREVDSFLMSALFQRLGIDMDQFEMTMSSDEYKLVLLRALLRESIESEDYDRTEGLLDEYENSAGCEKVLHKQYAGMLRAVLIHVRDKNNKLSLKRLKNALEVTFSGENEAKWNGIYFHVQEIQLMLLMGHVELEMGKVQKALTLLKKLYKGIDEVYKAAAVRLQVYPKCCYLLARGYFMLGKKKQAMEFSRKGLECLIENGSTILLEEILSLQQQCEWEQERKEQIEAFSTACRVADYRQPKAFAVCLLFCGCRQEIILSNELLREVRLAQKRSQEELSEGICARETLARIEVGRTPNRKYLQEILERLGIDREKYYSYVIAKNWEIYELVRDYKKNCFFENQENAMEALEKIKANIDMTIPANKQFVEMAYVRDKIRKKEITWEDAIEQLTSALRYTMPEYDGKIYRVPYREEFLVLNRIALCLKQSGRRQEAIAMYESMLKRYQSSKVKEEHHTTTMTMLYFNYSGLPEVAE